MGKQVEMTEDGWKKNVAKATVKSTTTSKE